MLGCDLQVAVLPLTYHKAKLKPGVQSWVFSEQSRQVDKLSEVLSQFSIKADVFYTGNLCGLSNFSPDGIEQGHLHLLQSGRITVMDQHGQSITLEEPSVLFFPIPTKHRLIAEENDAAQLVCASVRYGTGTSNPLANALPPIMVVKFSESESLRRVTDLLFAEAMAEDNGKLAMMDRLTEVFLIQLLRYAMQAGVVETGMLSGLAHPQLSKAIKAIHEAPEQSWSLESLAKLASMSRSKFAELFKERVGQTAGDYILEWRVALAQNLLKKGKPVGVVANEVGYENASALARVFRKKTGMSPKQWLTSAA